MTDCVVMRLKSMHYIELLSDYWRSLGVSVNPPAISSRVDDFARQHGVFLPNDFRAFYNFCNGIESTDDGFNAFWPIEEIAPVPAKISDFSGIPDYSSIADNLPDAANYFAFADHSICVCVYAIMLTNDPDAPTPVICITDSETFDTVAESFTQFWLRYIALGAKMLWP